MKEQKLNKLRLGAFVLIATLLLVLGLYYIGSQKNFFHSSISVFSEFNDVGGLMPGNNVRFNGINVGTVSDVYPVSDNLIRVEFTVDVAAVDYIGIDAQTSIGTDGLLGNKLVTIAPGAPNSNRISDGCQLQTRPSIEMEDALRTLQLSNENILDITTHLRHTMQQFDEQNSLWTLLKDSAVAENIQSTLVGFKITSDNTAILTGDLSDIVKDIQRGEGTVGALITDTIIYNELNQTIVRIHAVSDSLGYAIGDFRSLTEAIKHGQGATGTLISDTTFAFHLKQSMIQIDSASGNLNKTLIALRHTWPFKKYFTRKNQNK